MLTKLMQITSLASAVLFTGAAAADTWTLDGDNSRLAFASIKKDTVGEVHIFERMGGAVAADGTVAIEIDLSSVQTNIDIRNERMNEFVFGGQLVASLSAEIDMAAMQAIPVGGMSVIDVEGALDFLGQGVDIETEMLVARLSESQVMVTTNDMLFVSAEDLGITPGIDKLMALAKLPGITRTSPVTVRLVFNSDDQKAGAKAGAAPVEVALAGDAKAGKKVFKKCKACHKLKKGKNGAGPSLHNIMGMQAASVEGFKYSKAMQKADLVWDVETMSAFLQKPKSVVPKTKMQFGGLKKDKDIENLIAYLATK